MTWVALKMLTADRAKYLGIVFGVAFAALLMAFQLSIFIGILARTTSQIRDVQEADIWVMDPNVRYFDEIIGLPPTSVYRVRGVEGVEWAVKLYKGNVRVRLAEGNSPGASGDYRNAIVLGLDDETLIGAPREMVMGSLADLKKPGAIIVDESGYTYLFPGQPKRIGQILELTDHRAELVGICKAGSPFTALPIVYTRYSQALDFAPPERRLMAFVLATGQPGIPTEEVCRRIHEETGLQALTRSQFSWKTVGFILATTGIPVNFGITVLLGFIVGVAIAGQTFFLFTLENLKQFGALKAMGLTNRRIVRMILTQALLVGLIGYGVGIGLTAGIFEATKDVIALKGLYLPWQVMVISGGAVLLIVALASLLSIRRVLVLEPAVVFR